MVRRMSILVRADWDEEAGVWVASTNDIEGLAVEAETFERLEQKVVAAVSDLIELNGIRFEAPEIPIHIMADHLARIPNPLA